MPTPESSFADSWHFSLRSYKKSGDAVDTPVWFAPLDGKWVVFTDGTSFKVKRIQRNPTVQVARCDMRGKLLGPWIPGTARVLENEAPLEKRAYDALNTKYGLIMRIGTLLSTLSGRRARRKVLEIALDGG